MSELHDPTLTALEAALAGLAPASGTVDRDAVLFRAGQAAAQRGWLWPALASLSTAAALVFGLLLALGGIALLAGSESPEQTAPAVT